MYSVSLPGDKPGLRVDHSWPELGFSRWKTNVAIRAAADTPSSRCAMQFSKSRSSLKQLVHATGLTQTSQDIGIMRRRLVINIRPMFTLNLMNCSWPEFRRNDRSAVAVLAVEQLNQLSDTTASSVRSSLTAPLRVNGALSADIANWLGCQLARLCVLGPSPRPFFSKQE